MPRNSRFRSTSGPTTNRPFSEKGNTSKKSAKNRGDSSDKKASRPRRDNNISARESGFKPFTAKGKSFPKSDGRDKDSRPIRPAGTDKPAKEFSSRAPRSFSKGKSGSYEKRDAGAGKKFGGKSGGNFNVKGVNDREGVRPKERKSFVESRLEKQRKVRPAAEDQSPAPTDGLIRLNKFISNSGICSRREADDLIAMGLITVNGKSVTEMGYKVKPTDDVRHDGKRLKAEKPVYILLNKPKGFITTTDDPQERNTVMQLVQGACKERVYPVGRLDRNTSGLLLLTNDGDLTDKLTHPSYNIKKIYKAELDRPLTKNDFQKIVDGVRLEEGKAIVDDLAIVSEDGKTIGLEIHIGWNRIVRRIFEALDYVVVKLDRSVYATLDKKDLPRGHWRFLRQDEVIRLKHFQ